MLDFNSSFFSSSFLDINKDNICFPAQRKNTQFKFSFPKNAFKIKILHINIYNKNVYRQHFCLNFNSTPGKHQNHKTFVAELLQNPIATASKLINTRNKLVWNLTHIRRVSLPKRLNQQCLLQLRLLVVIHHTSANNEEQAQRGAERNTVSRKHKHRRCINRMANPPIRPKLHH